MIERFRIAPETFSSLASGHGGADTVKFLRNVWLSEHLLLLRFLVREVGDQSDELTAAYELLAQIQEHTPDVVRDLLALPWVGVWAVRCACRVRDARRMSASLLDDLSYLVTVAAVAAVRSGTDADLPIRQPGGRLVLPDLGTTEAVKRLRVRNGRLPIGRPMRRLNATQFTVTLDDLDPYRNCYARPVSPRLSLHAFERWQRLFLGAWDLLARHAPERAQELAAGLKAVVPLSAKAGAPGLSVTSENAFGALALTRPASPTAFATTLVHEFQHSKLGALRRLVPLYDSSAQERYFVPWREDPRPISGLLQGAYAFLAVADVWRAFRAESSIKDLAEQEFASLRLQVNHVLNTLDRSDRLTADGQRFLAHMRTSLEPMLSEPVPPHVARRASTLGWWN